MISAPPEKIWPLVTDINFSAKFSTEFTGAEWLDGITAPAVGARFLGRNTHPANGSWETTSTVTSCTPNVCFGWSVGDVDDPSATWRYDLETVADGTRVTQTAQIGPGRSGLSYALDAMPDKESKIVARRLSEHRANMTASLEGLKALVEQA